VLLVTVRDPQFYWEGYDYTQGVLDPVELVWYDDDWLEQYHTVLDYAASELPDDFRLDPSQQYLLAIRHSLGNDGKPATAGHSLNVVYLSDGSLADVYLPEVEGSGEYPAVWWPVGMAWNDREQLMVQAGEQLRVYDVEW